MLGADDPIDWHPRRVTIAGVSGAGKSTLGRRVSAILGIPYTELDSLFHGPGWVPRPSFGAEVADFTHASSWVTEWQYGSVKKLIAARADTMLWLDLPVQLALSRVVRRTVRRRLRREELWNGNIEPPFRTIFTDPDHILRWAVRTRNKLRTSVPELAAQFPHLHLVRLESQRAADRWLDALSRQTW